jgi:hypothetical protein
MNDSGSIRAQRKPERPPWAKELASELKRLGFPIDHFAALVGVNPSTLHRWMLKPLTDTRQVLIQRALAMVQADPLQALGRAKGNGPKTEEYWVDESRVLTRSWALVLAEAAEIVSDALGRAARLLRAGAAAVGDNEAREEADEISRLIDRARKRA